MAPEGQLFKAHACQGVHHHKGIVHDVEEVMFEIFPDLGDDEFGDKDYNRILCY